MIVPITVPAIRPMPPDRLVPPMTAAAIASSSYDMPIPACPLAGTRRRHHATEPGQQSGDGVDDDEMPLDANAGYARRLRVGADGVRVFPISRVPQQDVKDDGDDQENHDGHGACSQCSCSPPSAC